MFGYIKPFQPQLRMCEFEQYQAVYCGLCGQLGKRFGAAARLTLSYDFTFLCMLHYAVSGEAPELGPHRCYVNPLRKKPMCRESEALGFSSDTAIIMLYYKLRDNMQDGGFLDRLLGNLAMPVVGMAHKKAAAARPLPQEIILRSVERQGVLENDLCDSIDQASEPTAAALSGLCGLMVGEPRQKRILERLGYCVGRFVYLCDALDDLEDDVRKGCYNPLALRYHIRGDSPPEERDKVCRVARESLYATIAEAVKAFDLLQVQTFHPILDNIISMGMRASADEILSKKEKIP